MQINDKVRIKSSPYTMFEVGSIHTISYIDDRPYGIYLVDPFYENTDEDSSAQWPFHRDEVELIGACAHVWSEESRFNSWRSECIRCGMKAQGSCQ